MEKITGPLHGYWLACYTVAGPEGHFGYAKLCVERPRSVWEAEALRKVAVGPYASDTEALDAVLSQTRRRLAWREGDDLETLLDGFDPL